MVIYNLDTFNDPIVQWKFKLIGFRFKKSLIYVIDSHGDWALRIRDRKLIELEFNLVQLVRFD
jgi:hypothetical protein